MRNISQASLALLQNKQSLEPINIVAIQWVVGGQQHLYSDRVLPEYNIEGKILELADLENVISIDKGSNSTSVKVKLDDADGSMKSIFNNNDIHHRPVIIYQWFNGIPISDAFILFTGLISSPIVWSEGDRTLSFDVLSKLEDLEVGFSPEEGDFNFIADRLIGKMWPLIFGLVRLVPALLLTDIPRGTLKTNTIIRDPRCDEMETLPDDTGLKARNQALFWFLAALNAGNSADEAFNSGDVDAANQWLKLEDQYTDRGNKFLLESSRMLKDGVSLAAKCNDAGQLQVGDANVKCGKDFKQGVTLSVDAGQGQLQGTFSGEMLNITGSTHPSKTGNLGATFINGIAGPMTIDDREVVTEYDSSVYSGAITGPYVINAGTPIRVGDTFPVEYIVASIIPVYVLGVHAKRRIEGAFKDEFFPVPTTYYIVQQVQYGGINATLILMDRPLSIRGEGWDNEIHCDLLSTVGPNVVDILIWLIQNYSTDSFDAVSFNHVRTLVNPFPANFALLDRKPVVTLLKDIAFQARCSLWLDNGIFYIKYLPEEQNSIDTITEDDIETKTLEIETTNTEDLVTKLIAKWKYDYSGQEKDNAVILRNNMSKYGLHEKSFDFFIYNSQDLVTFAATFWIIRYSNIWKKVKLKTFLHKLNLETMDTVLLSFSAPYIGNGPIKALIESNHYNSDDHTISLEIWTPLLLGEMTSNPFAWPMNLDASYIFPTHLEILGPNNLASGNNIGAGRLCSAGGAGSGATKSHHQPYDKGLGSVGDRTQNLNGQVVSDIIDSGDMFIPQTNGQNTNITPNLGQGIITINGKQIPIDKIDAGNLVIQNGPNATMYRNGQQISLPSPTNPSQTPIEQPKEPIVNKKYKLKDFAPDKVIPTPASSFPGIVLSKVSGNIYLVNVFLDGLSNDPTQIQVQQLQIDPTETIPANTQCIVIKGKEWTMQVPVWEA